MYGRKYFVQGLTGTGTDLKRSNTVSRETLNAREITKIFLAGAAELEAHKDWINELNVFPVPDGDTGTNMTLTIRSAAREVVLLGDTDNMKDICKAMSSGSLRGARGNSGVILSQLIRGYGKVTRGETQVDVPLLASAFERATETAYKAVMKPKEGTILTVARGVSEKARELADAGEKDLEVFIPQIVSEAERVLATTPDLLPVLKQAGVVDSGGQGLVQFFKGCMAGLEGKEIDPSFFLQEPGESAGQPEGETQAPEDKELRFLYQISMDVLAENAMPGHAEKDLRKYLNTIGGNVECAAEGRKLTASFYTNDPGLAVQKALLYGELTRLDLKNLRVEAGAADAPAQTPREDKAPVEAPVEEELPAEHKDTAFITVAAGDGMRGIFTELGVDHVISGGQTMNPSTKDILDAIAKVNADTIYVLPNNKNIIMAANQAASMTEDKKVVVIPTVTIPQGITAVINFMPDMDSEGNRANMEEEIAKVRSAEITYSVRDTQIDGVEIRKDDIMGIGDSGILEAGAGIEEITLKTLHDIVDDTTEIVSIYYGDEVTEEEAQALYSKAADAFPHCDVELQRGGQPVYYYILSAE